MREYYINLDKNLNPNYNNEVHVQGCSKMPISNRRYLGCFENGIQAVEAAKGLGYIYADGCALCCPEAHKA